MKRLILTTLISALSLAMYAQGEMNAYEISKRELTGTARGVAMGGAFGALGGDLTGISINPAGLGVYTRSEVAATLNLNNTESETDYVGLGTDYLGVKRDAGKVRFQFNNIGGVFAMPLNNDDVPYLNFSFGYNRLKSFSRKVTTNSGNYAMSSSLQDYMPMRAGYTDPKDLMDTGKNHPYDQSDWLGIFGYSSSLIQQSGDEYGHNPDLGQANSRGTLNFQERGAIHSYDMSVGTTISDMFSLGLTAAITDVDYRLVSLYDELMETDRGRGDFNLKNNLKTEGTGWQLKIGAIFKPINEIRIGVAYHSPIWYKMTDYFQADFGYNFTNIITPENTNMMGVNSAPLKRVLSTDYHAWDYELRTPDKWVFSLAGVIAKRAILSIDYELTDYGKMKLYDDYGHSSSYIGANTYIKHDFKRASTVRVGAEFLVDPQIAIRAGYAWMQSPLEKPFKNGEYEVFTDGSVPHYILEGDRQNYTFGLGYRFTPSWYLDLGFVYATQKDDLYMFPTIIEDGALYDVDRISLKTKKYQGLLTLGYRF